MELWWRFVAPARAHPDIWKMSRFRHERAADETAEVICVHRRVPSGQRC